MSDTESYPRLAARTRGFTLGRPRSFTISPDGRRLLFLRSGSGTDPVQRLWVMDLNTGDERCIADPGALGAAHGDLPPEERARRERAREQAGGIVAYATDRAVARATFTLAGDLWVTDVDAGTTERVDVDPPVVDPRLDPTGRSIAWVHHGSVRVTSLADATTRTVAGEDDPDVTWGLAEFIAGEEMNRTRGHWWSPDGGHLLIARVDTSPVQSWWIADPVDPSSAPSRISYPAAGTPNADVSLWVVDRDGSRREVIWDRAALPYLADVRWSGDGAPLVTVQSRDQRRLDHLAVDPTTGATSTALERRGEPWIDLVSGVPAWLGDRLVSVTDDPATDRRRVTVDGEPVGPPGLQVREVLAVGDDIVVRASADDPTAVGVWRIDADTGAATALTPADGVHTAVAGAALVVQRSALDSPATVTTVTGAAPAADDEGTPAPARATWTVTDHSTTSPVRPRVRRLRLTDRRLEAALLRPADVPEDEPLPVLLDPYGGPHAQRVLQSESAFRTSQWFADQGFAVLVVDGRGTPGRSPSWEFAFGEDPPAVLDDQIAALEAAAGEAALDLDRVGIRGWSFGGYLAALAVLRRPDIFHAAVAGAPVTEWRLYDTHYTERYLGDPAEHADVYDHTSLLPLAPELRRPLLLIHGFADDNVVAAHTLLLSRALLEAGRPHNVLPLSGVTHMTPQEVVAENLLLLQAEFLRHALR